MHSFLRLPVTENLLKLLTCWCSISLSPVKRDSISARFLPHPVVFFPIIFTLSTSQKCLISFIYTTRGTENSNSLVQTLSYNAETHKTLQENTFSVGDNSTRRSAFSLFLSTAKVVTDGSKKKSSYRHG